MSTVKKILVPVDFSERSANGLRYAASLAKETKAEIIVLHVSDKNQRDSFQESLAAFEGWPVRPNSLSLIPIDRWLREKTLDLYNFVQETVGKPGLTRIKRIVEMGRPAKEIVQVAKRERVDLIVLSIERKSLASYLMVRAVFLKLSRKFPCPVLLTPPATEEWPGPREPMVSWRT